jgi:hypothetical protein
MARLPKITVYDNGGKTFDRYTIVLHGKEWVERGGLTTMLGLSHNPTHPQGFSQFTSGTPGAHLGKKITFSRLPKNIQDHVRARLEPAPGALTRAKELAKKAPRKKATKRSALDAFDAATKEMESDLHTMATLPTPGWRGPVAVFITPNGDPKAMPVSYEVMRRKIGGLLEVVRLPSGNVLAVDEEGLLKGLKPNPVSFLARRKIVGPVFFIPKKFKTRAFD